MWNKDELEGKGKKIKGKSKKKIGQLIDNEKLENEGVTDQIEGEAQETYGEFRRKVGDAVEEAQEKVAGK